MKGKFKKPIAFLMTLALILNMGFAAYAGAIPSNYNFNKHVEESTEGFGGAGESPIEAQSTVCNTVYNTAGYEIRYLLEGTNDKVPGLDTITGSAEAGTEIDVPQPPVDGYEVLAEQVFKFTVNENESLNKYVVYYAEDSEVELGENPDRLTEISTGITEASDFYYPAVPRRLARALVTEGGSDIVWPNPGAINLTKAASPVADTLNKWQVTLTIEGKNIQKTSKVVLVIDKSGSMWGSKMTNTILAAKEFVDKLLLPDGATEIAVVSFDKEAHMISNFTNYTGKEGLKTAIEGIAAIGGTNIQAGIRQAQILLDSVKADNEYMVLLGDGEPTYSYLVSGASGITLTGHDDGRAIIEYNNPQITDIDYDSIVGSGGDYTLNYRDYRYKIYCAEHGTHSTSFPDNNGTATIYEAGLAMDEGTKIYSIALSADTTGKAVLKGCQDSGYYELNSSDLSSISSVFGKIAGDIAYAASNGTVEDPMGDMFDLVSGATEITVSQGNIISAAENKIIWNAGNIAEGKPATMTYIVQIKAGADANILYPTNKATVFSYTDSQGSSKSKNFEIPQVSVGGGTIIVKGYLVNILGEPINSKGESVGEPRLAEELYSTSYSDSPLPYNQTYSVTESGLSGYQYVKYVWNEATGSDRTVNVELLASAPSQIVWFGYQAITDLSYTVKYYVDNTEKIDWQVTSTVPSDYPQVKTVPDKKPDGYKLDVNASTALPYIVTTSTNLIKVYYVPDDSQKLNYSVSYYKDGEETAFATVNDQVPATDPVVSKVSYDNMPRGYMVDSSASTALPFTVAENSNVIKVCYIKDKSQWHTVTYLGNGNDSGNVPVDSKEYLKDDTVSVKDKETLAKAGHDFAGWKMEYVYPQENNPKRLVASIGENGNIYNAGEAFGMPDLNVNMAAQWVLKGYTLTINYQYSNKDKASDTYTATLNIGGRYSVPSPAITGYIPSIETVSGEMGTENILVTVTYNPRTDITYKVNYYITGSNSLIAESKTVTGQTFGTKVTETAKSITDYNADALTKSLLLDKLEGNVINFYYAKKSSGGGGGGGGNPGTSTKKNNNTPTTTIVPEEIPLAAPELNKVDHYQYLQGYPDNTVRPEGNITREEVAAVFYRLLTTDYRGSIMTHDEKFTDVEANKWSTLYIATLANGGILEGNPDGTFKPHNYITKAELAAVTSRFDNLSPFEGDSFTDIAGHWANKYINSAAKKGWVKGNPNGTFEPNKYITRAEFATLVNNVLERRVHKANILKDAKKFPDLLESKWYYEAMMEAINSHHYNRMEDTYEEWTEIYYPDLDL